MYLTIPANATVGQPVPDSLLEWLTANNIDPAMVSREWPIEIRNDAVTLTLCGPENSLPASNVEHQGLRRPSGPRTEREYRITLLEPLNEALLGYLAARFGCVYGEGEVAPMIPSEHRLQPDEEAASLDDIAPLIDQLRQARADSKAAKEREDEAKAEILARLKQTGREYGTVAGQRVVHAKEVTSNTFQTVKFRAAHPDLAAEFTEPKTSIRLEIV